MSPPGKAINPYRIADLVVLGVLAGLVVVYCVDAARASTSVLNLILVLPLSAIVLLLCLVQLVRDLGQIRSVEQVAEREPMVAVLPVAGLFTAYILTLPWLGFDVGTGLFVGVFLWWHGERRWVWLLAYAIGFAFALSLFFSKMLPYPMPMLILETAY